MACRRAGQWNMLRCVCYFSGHTAEVFVGLGSGAFIFSRSVILADAVETISF